MRCPDDLRNWSLDEIAECFDVPTELRKKLWDYLHSVEPEKDMETPDALFERKSLIKHFWNKFSLNERKVMIDALEKYNKQFD